jgi:hypothetical protein
MINLDLVRGRADTHHDLFSSEPFLENDGYQQPQEESATISYFACKQMSQMSDSQHLCIGLPGNQPPSWMNDQPASLANSSQYEEIKDDFRVSDKEERIRHANFLLEELRKSSSLGLKPKKEKVYNDELLKDILRHNRRWVHNLLDPVLFNAKPN